MDRLVGDARERRPQPMRRRERIAVSAAAVAFVLAVYATAQILPDERGANPLLIAGLVLAYALVSNVEFEIGSGYAVPEALLFVPMLFLAPLELVPLLVAAAFVIARIPSFVARRSHVDRWLYSMADAWFTIGPVLVIGLLAPGEPDVALVHVYALAFVAQIATSVGPTIFYERVGKGVPVKDTLGALFFSYRIDAILWPVGLMAAQAASDMPLFLLAIGPLVWLLGVFSEERKERYAAALELNRAYRGTVMLLSDVVEADDNYTADHCRSVVELVNAVADELEVDDDCRQELEFAALLHDVGKIAIPKEILNKPGKLTDAEFELLKTHTVEGQELLDRVGGLLERVGGIVRSCHERWDGRGYPDGLMGEQIPLEARIVFCCDAFNAMTTDRPYREAMPVEDALEELRSNSGTQFDPWVVSALERVVTRGNIDPLPTPADALRAVIFGRDLPALEPVA